MNSDERIELHIHSKFGGDSTVYPGEIIRKLNDRGIPAVAITDMSNIYAFPEIEKVYETRNYKTRPVYGMEMPVMESDGNIYSISVLVKNLSGLMKLYDLISDNHSTEAYPVYQLEDLLRCREGLLLGSGVENGKIYKMLMSHACIEDLKTALTMFDYVEVIPFEKYRNANVKVIELCEELNIPVVAVSDAHFIDASDRLAYEMLVYWRQGKTPDEDYRFLDTKEMLNAFSYLPEAKAHEIVIGNTHRIAELCEMVTICPKERYLPKSENATEMLWKLCHESLHEKYTDAEMEEAQRRLETELNAVQKTGLETYVLWEKELLEKCGLRACDISVKGCAAGSIVLYLLNITEIDPLKYDLKTEIIFGMKGEREIDIDIKVPACRQKEVIKEVSHLSGVEAAVHVGSFQGVSQSMAKVIAEDYIEDTGHYPSEEKWIEAESKLSGNYRCRGEDAGGMIVFPKGYDYKKISPWSTSSDGTPILYYSYFFIDYSVLKLDVIGHDTPEMLIRLSELTGVDLADVPIESKEVLDLFVTDESGDATMCADLPEFYSERVRKIVSKLKPASFTDLVKIFALSHGTGCWEGNGEILVEEKGLGLKDIIGSRDDVFGYILSLGMDRKTAYEISEAVRKGIILHSKNAKWQEWKKELIQNGAGDWFLWSCEQIRYIFPKAHAVSYMIMTMRMGWFKVHYPKEFNIIMDQYHPERFY